MPAVRFPANNVTEFFWYFTDRAEEDEPYLLPTALMRYFDHVEVDVSIPGEGVAVFDTAEEADAALADAVRRSGIQAARGRRS